MKFIDDPYKTTPIFTTNLTSRSINAVVAVVITRAARTSIEVLELPGYKSIYVEEMNLLILYE